MSAITNLQSTGRDIPVSKIRELANRSMHLEGLIPLWFGEPDVPTPQFIIDPAHQAMMEGKTTYTEGLGKPWLRQAIASYMSKLYNNTIEQDRIAVTVSGTNAVNLAFQMLMSSGDRLVTTTPSFPTLLTVPALQYADIEKVPLSYSANGWSLDVERTIEAASKSKILLLNSPNNPTGWMMDGDDIKAVLEACRKTGTWIISDEVYSRIVYQDEAAPSFAEYAEPEDRVIIVNSFSKSWAMTGWRLGWLTMPPSLLPECEKLMEFSMSCAPEFVQAGGLAAIKHGEDFIAEQIARYGRAKDLSLRSLSAMDRVSCIPPGAAFYVFFKIDGVSNSAEFALNLAETSRLGIAPGTAFDPSLDGWFRICFAKDEDLLLDAFDRLSNFLEN